MDTMNFILRISKNVQVVRALLFITRRQPNFIGYMAPKILEGKVFGAFVVRTLLQSSQLHYICLFFVFAKFTKALSYRIRLENRLNVYVYWTLIVQDENKL